MATKAFTGGVVLKRGDGAEPEVFAVVPELKIAPSIGVNKDIIKVSNFDSIDNHEYIAAYLGDGVEVTLEWNLLLDDVQQTAIRDDVNDGVNRNFELTVTNGTKVLTRTFTVTMMGWNDDFSFEDAHKLSAKGKITGAIVDVVV